MLETYITRIENIKINTFKTMLNYLTDEKHNNHKNSHIISAFNNVDKSALIVNNKLKILANIKKQKLKGGRTLKISDKTLTFNIPKSYKANEKQLKNIQIRLYNFISGEYTRNNINVNKNDFFSNIHKQQNSHINFIIPYLDQNGKAIAFIKRKSFLKLVATAFTKIVDNELNTNIKTYISQTEELEKLEDFKESIEELTLTQLTQLKQEYKDQKLLKRFLDYAYKIKNKQQKQLEYIKDADLLFKTMLAIKNSNKQQINKESRDLIVNVLKQLNLIKNLNTETHKILKQTYNIK